MFCWSCGHENSDDQKFCGECGKSLFKPEKVIQDITTSKNFPRPAAPDWKSPTSPPTPPVKPIEAKLTSREPEIPKQTNPLIEEPRVVHEKPVAASSSSMPSQNVTLPPTSIR